MKSWKIVVAGEGGQGVQALAESLALAAYRSGIQALYIPNFGIEQRGGVSLAMVQLSEHAIGAPKFLIGDLVVGLSPRSITRIRRFLGPETILLYDSSLIEAPKISDQVVGLQSYDTIAPEAFAERSGYHEQEAGTVSIPASIRSFAVPAADLARKELHPRVFNMIILGAMIAVTGAVSVSAVEQALTEKLDRRFQADPALKEHNFRALHLGYELISQPVQTP